MKTVMEEKKKPLIFIDDLARACLSVDSLRLGNLLMEQVMEGKSLDFNVSKSHFMVIGNKSMTKEIEKELKTKEILLCGREMKQVESDKWLGDYLLCLGNSQSIITTVKKR